MSCFKSSQELEIFQLAQSKEFLVYVTNSCLLSGKLWRFSMRHGMQNLVPLWLSDGWKAHVCRNCTYNGAQNYYVPSISLSRLIYRISIHQFLTARYKVLNMISVSSNCWTFLKPRPVRFSRNLISSTMEFHWMKYCIQLRRLTMNRRARKFLIRCCKGCLALVSNKLKRGMMSIKKLHIKIRDYFFICQTGSLWDSGLVGRL